MYLMKASLLSIVLLGILIPSAQAVSTYTCATFPEGDANAHQGPGGEIFYAPVYVFPASVNNQQQVAGYYEAAPTIGDFIGFFTDRDGNAISYGGSSPNSGPGVASVAVNNLGQVAGFNLTGAQPTGFINSPDGSPITFGPPPDTPAQSFTNLLVNAMNDKGEVLGTVDATDKAGNVSRYWYVRNAGGQMTLFDPISSSLVPLLTEFPGGALNNFGVAVLRDRIRFADGTEKTLLFRSAMANGATAFYGINNQGAIVGDYNGDPSAPGYPFVSDGNGHTQAVFCPENPTARLTAYGINDNGVVSGSIDLTPKNGSVFLATPTGLHASAEISNPSWGFSPHAIGETSPSGAIYITSKGVADLHVFSVQEGARDANDAAADFKITNNTCTTSNQNGFETAGVLVPGEFCAVTFNFTPSAAGKRTAQIVVYDDSPDGPHVIRLDGTGLGKGSLAISNSSWTFATHPIGQMSGPGQVYIYNPGTETINFQSVAISGTNAADFAITSNSCGASLAAYRACTIGLQFRPEAGGFRSAALTLIDDSATSSQTISLGGFGR
jgi:hypothetical protein